MTRVSAFARIEHPYNVSNDNLPLDLKEVHSENLISMLISLFNGKYIFNICSTFLYQIYNQIYN